MRVTNKILEAVLLLIVLMGAYGQRDGWRDHDWKLFVFGSVIVATHYRLLRMIVQQSTHPDAPGGR